ncbi:MAG: YigZ family protein [Alicyclobacillaceae bacterium]|nr:YigZ family protein [Alicyclobacillaceae bacterium]
MEGYRTVGPFGEVEITIKRSRFIGRAWRVEEEERAQEILDDIRRRHWDATHNCYAYVIGRRGEIQRSSDDGEPAGTAGRPILEVLHQMELRDTLVVVTRYFGGVLLGAGGLIRAYSQAAAEAVRAAGIVTRRPFTRVRLRFSYPHYGKIAHCLGEEGWPWEEPEFAEDVRLTAYVPVGEEDRLRERLADASAGQVVIHPDGSEWLEEENGRIRVPSSGTGGSPEG